MVRSAQAELIRSKDLQVTEAALPAHLMQLLCDMCGQVNVTLRADIAHAINVAPLVYFKGLDDLSISRCALKVDDAAKTLLRSMSNETPYQALIVAAQFAITLVDEGLIEDQGGQATLTALALMEEAKEDPEWEITEKKAIDDAKAMIMRCGLMGLYMTKLKN